MITPPQVACVGPSVRMQEAWAAGLLQTWRLQETDRARQLNAELAAAQAFVPPAHSEWDAHVARAAAQRLLVLNSNVSDDDDGGVVGGGSVQGRGGHTGGSFEDAGSTDAEAVSRGGTTTSDQLRRERQLVTAYKACKAVAAGLVGPQDAAAAVATQVREFGTLLDRA